MMHGCSDDIRGCGAHPHTRVSPAGCLLRYFRQDWSCRLTVGLYSLGQGFVCRQHTIAILDQSLRWQAQYSLHRPAFPAAGPVRTTTGSLRDILSRPAKAGFLGDMLASRAARHLSRVGSSASTVRIQCVGSQIESADDVCFGFAAPMQWVRLGWSSVDVCFVRRGKGTVCFMCCQASHLCCISANFECSTCCCGMQAPMSRFEQDVFINDRYAAMEDRLAVQL